MKAVQHGNILKRDIADELRPRFIANLAGLGKIGPQDAVAAGNAVHIAIIPLDHQIVIPGADKAVLHQHVFHVLHGNAIAVAARADDLHIINHRVFAFVQIHRPGGWIKDRDIADGKIVRIGDADRHDGIRVAIINAAAQHAVPGDVKIAAHAAENLPIDNRARIDIDRLVGFGRNQHVRMHARPEILHIGSVGIGLICIGRIHKQMQRARRIAVDFHRALGRGGQGKAYLAIRNFRHNAQGQRPHNGGVRLRVQKLRLHAAGALRLRNRHRRAGQFRIGRPIALIAHRRFVHKRLRAVNPYAAGRLRVFYRHSQGRNAQRQHQRQKQAKTLHTATSSVRLNVISAYQYSILPSFCQWL